MLLRPTRCLGGCRQAPAEISVWSSGTQPQLAFACCDQGVSSDAALFADPATVAALRDLAMTQVAVAIADFSPERAQTVRLLNQQDIPAVAWMIMLPEEDGVYFNADNAAVAASRIDEFERWTAETATA